MSLSRPLTDKELYYQIVVYDRYFDPREHGVVTRQSPQKHLLRCQTSGKLRRSRRGRPKKSFSDGCQNKTLTSYTNLLELDSRDAASSWEVETSSGRPSRRLGETEKRQRRHHVSADGDRCLLQAGLVRSAQEQVGIFVGSGTRKAVRRPPTNDVADR